MPENQTNKLADFLIFIECHYGAILLLILMMFSIVLVINWLARIFTWGMFKTRRFDYSNQSNFTYILSRFLVNLIDDFKHLLALVVVIIFTSLIIYSMASTNDFDKKMEALQLVIASLGGLLGSIIGYYFGESAGRKSVVAPLNPTEPDTGDVNPAPTITDSIPIQQEVMDNQDDESAN